MIKKWLCYIVLCCTLLGLSQSYADAYYYDDEVIESTVPNAPITTTSGIIIIKHPDHGKEQPVWTLRGTSARHFSYIKLIMNINMADKPFIRMWKNLTDEDKQHCPSCDGTYSEIANNEIWLTNDSTQDDLIYMIVMYYQSVINNMSQSMLFSTTAKGERDFYFNMWQQHQGRPRIITNPTRLETSDETP
jgi:hypothetical protein